MINYIIRRVLYAIPILIGVNLFTFALFFVVNTPDDIARMVAFLLAIENGYITGQTIFVCGTSISGTGGQ